MNEQAKAEPATGPSGARKLIVAIPVVVFVALAAMLYFRLYGGDPSTIPSALIGRPAPDMTLPGLDGLKGKDGAAIPGFSRADLATGEVTVVNVFASWCAPCRQEHPILMEMGGAGVRILGLNYKDDPENARRFLAGLGNPFRLVGTDPAGRAAIEWGVYGVPETFVVDGKGRIAFKFVGPLTEESARTRLLPEIEKAKAAK